MPTIMLASNNTMNTNLWSPFSMTFWAWSPLILLRFWPPRPPPQMSGSPRPPLLPLPPLGLPLAVAVALSPLPLILPPVSLFPRFSVGLPSFSSTYLCSFFFFYFTKFFIMWVVLFFSFHFFFSFSCFGIDCLLSSEIGFWWSRGDIETHSFICVCIYLFIFCVCIIHRFLNWVLVLLFLLMRSGYPYYGLVMQRGW